MRLVVVGAARGWHATRIAAEASRRGHGVTVVEWPLLGAAIPAALLLPWAAWRLSALRS